jgi:uncharacterized protein YndB with AHSA1/START domain
MVPDRIEREILIDAPLDAVWSIVTQPEHVGGWFSDAAEIDLRPDGEGVLTWNEYGGFRLRVERVEPPHAFAFRWARPAGAEPRAGNATLVEFTLSAEGAGTRLRVVESGFRGLDTSEEETAKHVEDNSAGWDHELGELREYAARKVGAAPRR